jgi:hypothetical protein
MAASLPGYLLHGGEHELANCRFLPDQTTASLMLYTLIVHLSWVEYMHAIRSSTRMTNTCSLHLLLRKLLVVPAGVHCGSHLAEDSQ